MPELVILRDVQDSELRHIKDYLKASGYQTLRKVLLELKPEQVVDEVKKSVLRGRGGDGYPTGMKWWTRLNPPFPALVGFYGCPTVINNVETLAAIPRIMERGGDWFASLGTPKNGGTRLFAVSGHVNKPGTYELPLGIPLREII